MSEAIQAYHSVTATNEFKNLEWIRRKTAHDEAQALYNARLEESEKWQEVVADKDAVIADKDALIAELMARLKMQNS